MRKKHIWTDEEKDYLIKNFENTDISKAEMMAHLKVGLKQLDYEANVILKLFRKGPITKKFKFTEKHEQYLRKNYENENISLKTMAKRIGADNINIIMRKASRMGLKRNPDWTTKDLNRVIKDYPKSNTFILAAELGRTPTAVTRIANKYSVHKPIRPKIIKQKKPMVNSAWMKEEALLIEIFDRKDISYLAKIFNRNEQAIDQKLRRLGINEKRLKVYKRGGIRFFYNDESEIADKLDYCDFWIKAARSKKLVGGFSHARLIDLEERTRTA